MGLSQMWRLKEDEAEEIAARKAGIEEQMLEIHDFLDSLHRGDGWEALLRKEQEDAFKDMMAGEADQILLARERAKIIARILRKKSDAEADLDRLRAERNALEE